ncbi:hypothetical protein [Circoviridae 12 LDMD-2013]|nr:hypothetical protein [Circoviridae 12 LDMD-2013]
MNGEYDASFVIAHPSDSKSFRRLFGYEQTTIILGPGQTENYTVQGPSNYKFSYSKHWRNGKFVDLDPSCRAIMQVVRVEHLSYDDRASHGIPEYNIVEANGEVEVECIKYFNIEMPDQTGATGYDPVRGLNKRRSVMMKFNDLPVPGAGPRQPVTSHPQAPDAETQVDS